MKVPIVLYLLVSGCAVPSVDEQENFVKDDDECDFMCGGNSPKIDHLGFHDLHMWGGLPSKNGFRLAGFRDPSGKPQGLAVTGAQIKGISTVPNTPPLIGASLIGSQFTVTRDNTSTQYLIKIADVGRVDYWAKLRGAVKQAVTYRLQWAQITNVDPVFEDICSKTADAGGISDFHAVVFEGDRVDAERKVDTEVDLHWFNIGCAGHLLAKLHLMGHTEGAKVGAGFATKLDERTTVVKMLSADYCGRGKAFTVAGVELTWRDDKSWMALSPITALIEARFGPNGATCLDTPRLLANPTDEGPRCSPI